MNKLVKYLIFTSISTLLLFGYYGDRISNSIPLLLFVIISMIVLITITIWMFYDCIMNRNIENKITWIVLFIFGTFITAIYYYVKVYSSSSKSNYER